VGEGERRGGSGGGSVEGERGLGSEGYRGSGEGEGGVGGGGKREGGAGWC